MADEEFPVIARFEVRRRSYLAPDGSVLRPLPAFASDTATLLALYRGMVLTRAFDLKLGDEVQAFDIMGNQTENRAIKLQQSPIYFHARHAEAIARVFGQQ